MHASSDIADAAAAVMSEVSSIGVTVLPGGSSAFVALLHICGTGGAVRDVVFRQHVDKVGKGHDRGVAAKEFHLTNRLRELGLAVSTPLALHGEEYVDGPWLVTDVVDGRPAVGQMRDDRIRAAMARFLARLHDIEHGSWDVPGLEPIEDPIAALPQYLADDDVGRRVGEQLHRRELRGVSEPRLLHGDYWPGNVLVRDGCIEAVLDWEDAKIGDPLADLACARVEITCDGGADAAARFTAEYCAIRRDVMLDDLAVWDAYVAATALSSMHLWGLAPSDERARRSTTSAFLVDATERLATSNS